LTELARQVPRFATLNEWLAWQEQLHPHAIELGLDRVRRVLWRLGLGQPGYPVITVGGTNGKGSTVAFLEAMLRAAGYRVGAYFSPHILRYNERIRIDGREVGDSELCAAFERVDAARGEVSLTYFEFGTLAAFDLFRCHDIEVGVLEVGLGGRLDAVNVLDADCAVVTTVDLDHCDWLGPDRESIGFEKAGIYRAGRPAICADREPPTRLLDQVRRVGAILYRLGVDYHYRHTVDHWCWWGPEQRLDCLPLPVLHGGHQLVNAATALLALDCLRSRLKVDRQALEVGLIAARLPGRFQVLPGPIEWIYDVAHNPQAARALAVALMNRPIAGRTLLVLAMLRDKDCAAVARELAKVVDVWYPAGLGGARGRSGADLTDTLVAAGIAGIISVAEDVATACAAAAATARPGDRVVVCGSFHTVASALRSAQLEEVDCG
jgi:dihydrofolate synthase / folylpolyglutamate synthase